MADTRTGLATSSDERDGADGAAAFAYGPDPAVEIVSGSATTAEFLDRWRHPARSPDASGRSGSGSRRTCR